MYYLCPNLFNSSTIYYEIIWINKEIVSRYEDERQINARAVTVRNIRASLGETLAESFPVNFPPTDRPPVCSGRS